jgi:hypothetical protein
LKKKKKKKKKKSENRIKRAGQWSIKEGRDIFWFQQRAFGSCLVGWTCPTVVPTRIIKRKNIKK